MRPTPNPEQKRAIEWGEGDLAISAGAGSGKTAVLALRVARAVTQGISRRGPLDMAGVAAITYTKKAAGELAERVRRELMLDGRVDEARRIDEAWISTIDGLCGRILRRYALDVGVDPRYRAASVVEAGILSGEVLDVLEAEAHAQGGAIADLFDQYELDALREATQDAYGRLRAMGATVDQIDVAGADTSIGEALSGWASSLDVLLSAIDEAGCSGVTREANSAMAQAAQELVVTAQRASGFDQAIMLRDGLAAFKPSASADADAVKHTRAEGERLSAAVNGLIMQPVAEAFLELLGRYESAYGEAKRDAGVLDFSDVVTHTARLLAEDNGVAESLRADLGLVMVDEFQDTNELRLRAIEPLSRDDLCIVGDDKQSIYRFQFADVEVFRRMRERIGETVELDQNYRSRLDILEFVNKVFSAPEFFGSDLLKLRAARTTPDIVPWPESDPRVETIEVECGDEWDEGPRVAEAAAAASRASELVKQGIRPDDIVVLLSGMTQAREYASALRVRGVEAHVASGESLSDSPAVAHIRSFLRVLVLASDDQAMIDVLAGPLMGVSPDGLIALHERGRKSIFDAVIDVVSQLSGGDNLRGWSESDRAAIVRFAQVHETLAATASRKPVAQVIQETCELTDYDLVLAIKGSEGEHEWAQVLRLKRLATQWQESGCGGVGGFLEHLSAMERYGEKEPAGPSATTDEAVRIMSIHSAKGLQFPVVIVGRLGSGLVHARSKDIVLERVDDRPTLAMVPARTGDGDGGARTAAVQHVRDTVKGLDRDEALRLLYVAFTRAEDALILVGAKVRNKKGLSSQNGLGLVLTALGDPEPRTSGAGGGGVRVSRVSTDTLEGASSHEPVAPAQDLDVEQATIRHEESQFICAAQESEFTGWRPVSVSYSSLQQYDDCPFSFYADRVLGLRRLQSISTEGVQATDVGSAVHEVLEHLPSPDSEALLEAAAGRHRLSEEGEARLRLAVAAFEASPFATRLEGADRVIREARIAVILGKTDLVGSIDAVAWEGDRILVIDYKTGQDRLLSRSKERIGHYRLQGECYALAAFAAGAKTVEVRFVFLEQGADSIRFDFVHGQSEDVRETIQSRIDAMMMGTFPPLKEYDAHLCGRCSAHGSPCSVTPSH
ncbi:MAG: UvrD-helicase domain-containing protein [Actinomycetota bacterium]|jgi:ATP-dependent helicase/nuclease subunit A|nr:UvrD-helicase domain-containing protein [Actinomycetota bacterium]